MSSVEKQFLERLAFRQLVHQTSKELDNSKSKVSVNFTERPSNLHRFECEPEFLS